MNIRNNYILLSVIAAVGAHAADDAALRGGQASRLLPKKEKGQGGGGPFSDATTDPTEPGIVCAQDVRGCPDGTTVERDQSNNCQFPCCYLGRKKGKNGGSFYASPEGGSCDANGYSVPSTDPVVGDALAATCHNNEPACSASDSQDPLCAELELELGCEDKGQTCGFCNPICVDANNPDDGSSPIVLNCGGLCYGSACCQENPGLPNNATYCF